MAGRPSSNRGVSTLATALLTLGVAASAHADPRLYTGSLVLHTFGNDTTTGTAPPFGSLSGFAVGIPLTGNCQRNPYHAKETLVFPTTPNGTQVFTLTIPAYGGAEGVDTDGDGYTDGVPGCGDATLHSGDPLTGVGVVHTTGVTSISRTSMDPRAFTLPRSALNKVKSGASLSTYGVYLWDVHFADLHNEAATFAKHGGDGSFVVAHAAPGKAKRKAAQTAGKNRFGGVMRLLGSYGDNVGYFNATLGATSVLYYDWLLAYLGQGGQATTGGVVTAGYVKTGKNRAYTRDSGALVGTYIATVEAFKWTTGSVTVTALGGTFPTILRRQGYDHRTARGSGAVQLVSPMLTRWTSASFGTMSSTGSIGILKVTFAPEPGSLALLSAGVTVVGLLFCARRRAGRHRPSRAADRP